MSLIAHPTSTNAAEGQNESADMNGSITYVDNPASERRDSGSGPVSDAACAAGSVPCPLLRRLAAHGWHSDSGVPLHQWLYDKHGGPQGPRFGTASESLPVVHMFYGYSGPGSRLDGFDKWCTCLGLLLGFRVIVFMADICNEVDLADDIVWHEYVVALGPNGKFLGSLWSPPCSTFSRARSDSDGGPRILRGPSGPALLGLPDLRPEEKEKVRLGTLLATRSGEGITAQDGAGCPWILENPPEGEDRPSLFRIPLVQAATTGPGAHRHVLPQCPFGAEATKLTEFRASFRFSDAPPRQCPHERVWWRQPPSGRWFRAPHPVLKGKFRAVTPAEWDRMSISERGIPGTEFLTRASAAYPNRLNCYLACQLVPRACMKHVSTALVRKGRWRNVLASAMSQGPMDTAKASRALVWDEVSMTKRKPTMMTPLREQPADVKEMQERQAIGGMRRPHQSVAKLPSVVQFGAKLHGVLNGFLDESASLQRSILEAIGSEEPDPGPTEAVLDALRPRLAAFLQVDDWGPVQKGDFSTCIRAGLWAGWQALSGDPESAVPNWLQRDGVPAGLRRHPEDCRIFPRTDIQATAPEDLITDFDSHCAYSSVESDDVAWEEISTLVQRGWLREFPTLAAVTEFLGETPVLSKFGMVIRTRAGRTKRRLILDSKVSGVSGAASKLERILLPRLLDVAVDVLELLMANPGQPGNDVDTEFMVLDFQEAYWHMPLSAEERKWFVAKLRGRFFVFLRNAQGSRNAPGGWGRLAAMLGRMVQSMFHRNVSRLETYTDDPCLVVRGSRACRDRVMSITILLWRLLGLPLSWRKGSRGRQISWIGGHFDLKPQCKGVIVRISQDIFDEAEALVVEFGKINVIPKGKLSTAIGKLGHIANLIQVWRPFMAPLYAALHADTPPGCPPGCVWSRQVAASRKWFRIFFSLTGGFVERDFDVRCYMSLDLQLEIVLDASPWSLGGILLINGVCQEFFASALSNLDETLFSQAIGSPDGQQVWESLAALVALRLWRPIWGRHSLTLRVKGDSMTMLSLIVNLRPSTPQLGLIGREIALEYAQAVFVPVLSVHIPGVANVTADKLSRGSQPGYSPIRCAVLADAVHRTVPTRDRSYYLTLCDDIEPVKLGMVGSDGVGMSG